MVMKPTSQIGESKSPSPYRRLLSKSPVRIKIKQPSVQVLQSASLFKKPVKIEMIKKEPRIAKHLVINLSETQHSISKTERC